MTSWKARQGPSGQWAQSLSPFGAGRALRGCWGVAWDLSPVGPSAGRMTLGGPDSCLQGLRFLSCKVGSGIPWEGFPQDWSY